MTTIAYHHDTKTIAVDSRMVSHGIVKNDSYNKTIKNDAGLWVFCGDASDIKDLCQLKHNDHVKIIPNCSAFLIADGACYEVSVNNDGYCQRLEIDFNDAKGSGSELAIAAMDHGKGAADAVKYAMTRDIYSGGAIKTFKV